jgi:hypothetical protein
MCSTIVFNDEARRLYLNNILSYSYLCGQTINLPCICCIFRFELLFLRDNRNRDYVQYMDVSCFDV